MGSGIQCDAALRHGYENLFIDLGAVLTFRSQQDASLIQSKIQLKCRQVHTDGRAPSPLLKIGSFIACLLCIPPSHP